MIRIDARGMRCPWPAIRLARALRDAPAGVEIIADDPAAPGELAAVAAAAGWSIAPIADAEGAWRVDPPAAVNGLFTDGA